MTHEEPGRLDETVAAQQMAAQAHSLVAAVQWIDEPPWRALRDGGVPAFRRVGSACRALAAAHRFATAEVRVTPEWPAAGAAAADTGYMAARELLAAGGVPFADAAEVRSADEALAAAGRIGYPVVLKALGAEHKSDGGGVVLGLGDPEALAAAVADLAARLEPAVVQRRADGRRAGLGRAGVRRDLGSAVRPGGAGRRRRDGRGAARRRGAGAGAADRGRGGGRAAPAAHVPAARRLSRPARGSRSAPRPRRSRR